MHDHFTLPLEIKALSDEGTFEGYASVTSIKDLGRDIVEPGAFKATIAETGGRFPLHLDHDLHLTSRLGYVEATEDETGLRVKGFFNLEKQVAREIHSDLKHAHAAGLPVGMSIGYTLSKKARHVKGVRHLDALKVWEVTLTGFPMNTEAMVEGVKAADTKDFATTFDEVMQRDALRRERWKMSDALSQALENAMEDAEMTDAEKLAAITTSIDQFRTAYLSWAARALAAFKAMPGGIKTLFDKDALDTEDVPLEISTKAGDEDLLPMLLEIKKATGLLAEAHTP